MVEYITSSVIEGPILPFKQTEFQRLAITNIMYQAGNPILDKENYYLNEIEKFAKTLKGLSSNPYTKHLSIRSQNIHKNESFYYPKFGTSAHDWHVDGFSDEAKYNIVITIGINPTEFIIGDIPVIEIKDHGLGIFLTKSFGERKSSKRKICTYPNQIIAFDKDTFHRAAIPKESGSRAFIRYQI